MNQEKIGKFIAKKRKDKKMTQEILAEKLGVSINAVSKWERGICMMELLSEELDVTINEILSGEEITEENLKNKTDENIVNIVELYDLKAIKNGTIAFTIALLFFLIYFSRNNIDTLPIIIIWCIYNLTYTLYKYKFTKNKKEFILLVLYGIGLVVTTVLFLIETL